MMHGMLQAPPMQPMYVNDVNGAIPAYYSVTDGSMATPVYYSVYPPQQQPATGVAGAPGQLVPVPVQYVPYQPSYQQPSYQQQ